MDGRQEIADAVDGAITDGVDRTGNSRRTVYCAETAIAEITKLDTPEFCQSKFGMAVGLVSSYIDFGFNVAHLLFGDEKEVAGAAGRIEYSDPRNAFAQIGELAGVAARLVKRQSQVVKKKLDQYLQDIRDAGVVRSQRPRAFCRRRRLESSTRKCPN